MAFKFNPFTGTLDITEAGSASPFWLDPVADEASLPLADPDGAARVTLDSSVVYVFDTSDSKWHRQLPNIGAFGGTSTSTGLDLSEVTVGDISSFEISLRPADASNPGALSTVAQTIAGDKTFANNVVVTGDFTVNGTTTTINTTNLEVTDQNILVNDNGNDVSAEGAGLTVERTGVNGSIIYEDTLTSKWKVGALGSEIEITTVTGSQTLEDKTIVAANNTITTAASGNLTSTELNAALAELQTDVDGRASTSLDNLSSVDYNTDITTTGGHNLISGNGVNSVVLGVSNPGLSNAPGLGSTSTLTLGANNNITLLTLAGSIVAQNGLNTITIDPANNEIASNSSSIAFEPGGDLTATTGNLVVTSGTEQVSIGANPSGGDITLSGGDLTIGADTIILNSTADINLNQQVKITNVADPTLAQDVSTKAYTDAQIAAIPASANQSLSNLSAVNFNTNISTTGSHQFISSDGIDSVLMGINAVAPGLDGIGSTSSLYVAATGLVNVASSGGGVAIDTGSSGNLVLNANNGDLDANINNNADFTVGGTTDINSTLDITLNRSAGATLTIGGSSIDVNNFRITGVSDPVAAQDVATRAFVLANSGGGDLWSDPLDSNIIPDTTNSYSIGNTSFTLSDVVSGTFRAKSALGGNFFSLDGGNQLRFSLSNNLTGADGVSNSVGFQSSLAVPSGGRAIFSSANVNSGSSDSVDIEVMTGNNNGTGNTGDLIIGTGTPSSGSRGSIILKAGAIDFNNVISANVPDPTTAQQIATKNYVDNNSISRSTTAISSDVALTTETFNLVDTSAARTLTLPAAADGAIVRIKDSAGSANTNNITVNTPGAETIDGAASLTISSDFAYTELVSDGTNWFIV